MATRGVGFVAALTLVLVVLGFGVDSFADRQPPAQRRTLRAAQNASPAAASADSTSGLLATVQAQGTATAVAVAATDPAVAAPLQTVSAISTRDAEIQVALIALATREAASGQAAATAEVRLTAAQATIEALSARLPTPQPPATATQTTSGALSTAQAKGRGAEGTVVALSAGRATAQAQAIAAEATSEAAAVNQRLTTDQLATARAEVDAIQGTVTTLSTQQADAIATATALSADSTANALDPTPWELGIPTDLNGMLRGDAEALDATREHLRRALAPYATGCRAGVVQISGNADLGPGNDLARVVEGLLKDDFAAIFTDDTGYERFAQPGVQPGGGVQLKIYFYAGCEPAAG